jgi:outer membrane receptor for ferric coprogen and ferric-rhodotorulic acid
MYDGLPSSYSPFSMAVQPNLAMFDRVEIVRGATGLVTGAGNPSAAINLVRKRPTADQRVTLTGAAGSWDDYRGEIDASSKLNESGTLRGRVVSSYQGADSFRDKEQNDHGLFYAIGEADLSESTTATLGFSRQNEQTNYFWGGLPIGTDGHHLDLPRSTYPGTDWENRKLQIDTVFGEVEHRFDNDWKLHLAGSSSTLNGEFSGTYLSRYAGPLETTAYHSTLLPAARSKPSAVPTNWSWVPATAPTMRHPRNTPPTPRPGRSVHQNPISCVTAKPAR